MIRVIKYKAGRKGDNVKLEGEVKLNITGLTVEETRDAVDRWKNRLHDFLREGFHTSEITIK